MSGKIFVVQGDESLRSLSEQDFDTEDDFQTLLEKYPDLIPGEQIDEMAPRRWLLVSREYGVPDEENAADRWSLDHLFLDQDGVPTLVEVKRRSDARLTNARREVVGQMLDYAANAVVYWPVETMRARFEAGCVARGEDASEKLSAFLETSDESAIEQFWQNVKVNLAASKLRLLFVADFIPPELRRIVDFLNANMSSVEVLAVEIKHFVGTDANGAMLRTLVPRVFGQTAQAEIKKTSSSPRNLKWSQEKFLEYVLNKFDNQTCKVVSAILDWIERKGLTISWGASINGSFSPQIHNERGRHRLFFVYGGFGKIEFALDYMKDEPPFDNAELLEEWRLRLKQVFGNQIDTTRKFPGYSLQLLADEQKLQQLLAALDWALEQIRK